VRLTDVVIEIPMDGMANSINVATAARHRSLFDFLADDVEGLTAIHVVIAAALLRNAFRSSIASTDAARLEQMPDAVCCAKRIGGPIEGIAILVGALRTHN
jgi:hypothetical protein